MCRIAESGTSVCKAQPIKRMAYFQFVEPNDAGFTTRTFSTEEVVTPVMVMIMLMLKTGERSCCGGENHRKTCICCIRLHGTGILIDK